MVGSDDALVLANVFGYLGDGPRLLVRHHFVQEGQGVSDF